MNRWRSGWPGLVLPCTFALCTLNAHAQSEAKTDSLYEKIRSFAEKRKVTRWLHDALFVQESPGTDTVIAANKPARQPHRRYRGRPIRRVVVRVLDPFGSNVNDTALHDMSLVERAGNRLHRRTRERIVRDLLLFKEDDPLDPLRLGETERILRRYPLVNDARVTVVPTGGRSDPVDVWVIVQDRWSIEGEGSADLESVQLQATDKNLLGWGQRLDQRFAHSTDRARPIWSGEHTTYALGKSFISSNARYRLSDESDEAAIAFSRPFLSSVTRWAGAISASQTNYTPSMDPDVAFAPAGMAISRSFNTWAGYSLPMSTDSSEASQDFRYVLSVGYDWIDHELPPELLHTSTYRDTRLALASFQLSGRQYATESHLYRFGSREDVPEGLLLNATVGFGWTRGDVLQPYTGTTVTIARYSERGRYLILNAGIGTFWRNAVTTDSRLTLGARGFSELWSVGRWKFRQFGQCAFTKTLDAVLPNTLDLAGAQLVGMDPSGLTGDQKLVIRTEAVAYMPYTVLGFRFAPVLVLAAGTVGQQHDRIDRTTYRGAVGLGVLVRNERLLSNTFSISFAIYPGLPPDLGDTFRYNALSSLSVATPDLAPERPGLVPLP